MYIYLVRHGTSVGNIDKSQYFKKLDCDIELADKGIVDAESAANKIMDLVQVLNTDTINKTHFNIVHSSYIRAKQTADIIVDNIQNYPDVFTVANVYETPICREREWGGLRDIVSMGSKTEDHFNFYYRPTGGESFADCYQRVMIFHQWLMATSKQDHNIVVAHGEFNKLYLMHLLNWTVDEFNKYKGPGNGEVFLIRLTNDKFTNRNTLSSATPLTISHRYEKVSPSPITLD